MLPQMFGELPEFNRRWTRKFLMEKIKDYLQSTYDINSWEKTTKRHYKWGNEDMWIKTMYRRDADFILVKERMQEVFLTFYVPTIECYGHGEYIISFRRYASPQCGEGYWWGDLFQLNNVDSYNGQRGMREASTTVKDIIRILQYELEDSDIERDRAIYEYCENLIVKAYLKGIRAGKNYGAKYDGEFIKSIKENGLPFMPFEIVNELFYGGYQGGTHTREKMAELFVNNDRKVLAELEDIENED